MFDKKTYAKAYRLAHKEELKEKSRQWRKRNPQKVKKYIDYQRNWFKEHPGYVFEHNLKTKYGLSLLQFNIMLDEQRHKCALCYVGLNPPCVDHDHITKEVRALLCFHCNALLGNAKENPNVLRRAAEYIEAFSTPSPK